MDKLKSPNPLADANGSALVRAAISVRRAAKTLAAADERFSAAMQSRYELEDGYEMPDELVEVIGYAHGKQHITIDWIDRIMAAEGHTPNEKAEP